MIDSIAGAGAPQNVSQVKNNQTQKSERQSAPISAGDEVSLSSEAQTLSDIDALTAQVRSSLEGSTESLSSGERLDILL